MNNDKGEDIWEVIFAAVLAVLSTLAEKLFSHAGKH